MAKLSYIEKDLLSYLEELLHLIHHLAFKTNMSTKEEKTFSATINTIHSLLVAHELMLNSQRLTKEKSQ